MIFLQSRLLSSIDRSTEIFMTCMLISESILVSPCATLAVAFGYPSQFLPRLLVLERLASPLAFLAEHKVVLILQLLWQSLPT